MCIKLLSEIFHRKTSTKRLMDISGFVRNYWKMDWWDSPDHLCTGPSFILIPDMFKIVKLYAAVPCKLAFGIQLKCLLDWYCLQFWSIYVVRIFAERRELKIIYIPQHHAGTSKDSDICERGKSFWPQKSSTSGRHLCYQTNIQKFSNWFLNYVG